MMQKPESINEMLVKYFLSFYFALKLQSVDTWKYEANERVQMNTVDSEIIVDMSQDVRYYY